MKDLGDWDNLLVGIIIVVIWGITMLIPVFTGNGVDSNTANMTENALLMVLSFFFGKHTANGNGDTKKNGGG